MRFPLFLHDHQCHWISLILSVFNQQLFLEYLSPFSSTLLFRPAVCLMQRHCRHVKTGHVSFSSVQ